MAYPFKQNVLGREDMFGTKAGFAGCLYELQLLLQHNALQHKQRQNLETELDLLWKRHNLLAAYHDTAYKRDVFGLVTKNDLKRGGIKTNSLLNKIERIEKIALSDVRKKVDLKRLLRQWEAAQHRLITREGMYKDQYVRGVL